MVEPAPPRTLRSVAEALGTGAIPDELSSILTAHSQNVCMDGTSHTPEERSGWRIHSLLAHLVLGEVLVPGLERVTLDGVDPDGRVHLMHLLFSVQVNAYSTQFCLFACLGELPAKAPHPVMEIPPDFFAARRFIRAVPQVDHIMHPGGISLLDWQTKSCNRDKKSAGTEYVDLACRTLTFVSLDCASWLLQKEADGIINAFEVLKGLPPLLTGRKPPFEAALD